MKEEFGGFFSGNLIHDTMGGKEPEDMGGSGPPLLGPGPMGPATDIGGSGPIIPFMGGRGPLLPIMGGKGPEVEV